MKKRILFKINIKSLWSDAAIPQMCFTGKKIAGKKGIAALLFLLGNSKLPQIQGSRGQERNMPLQAIGILS